MLRKRSCSHSLGCAYGHGDFRQIRPRRNDELRAFAGRKSLVKVYPLGVGGHTRTLYIPNIYCNVFHLQTIIGSKVRSEVKAGFTGYLTDRLFTAFAFEHVCIILYFKSSSVPLSQLHTLEWTLWWSGHRRLGCTRDVITHSRLYTYPKIIQAVSWGGGQLFLHISMVWSGVCYSA